MATAPLTRLSAEFKANPRLRGGMWLCIAILWVYGILHLQDAAVAKGREFEALAKRIARIQAVADQKSWQSRVDEAQSIEKALIGRLWREQTQGLAQAAFQDWILQMLQQMAIPKPQLTVVVQDGPKPPGESGSSGEVWKVSARVAFDFNPKTFTQLIDKLAGHEKLVVLETLNIRSAPSPRAEMTLVAYFVKTAE